MKNGAVTTLLLFLVVFNLFDAFSTMYLLQSGCGEEANPLMNYLYMIGPWVFFWGKMAISSLGALYLWHKREDSFAQAASVMLFLVYLSLCIHQGHMLWIVYQLPKGFCL